MADPLPSQDSRTEEAERKYFDSVLRAKAKDSPDMTVKEWHDRLFAKQTYTAATDAVNSQDGSANATPVESKPQQGSGSNGDIDSILDWQTYATMEAMFESDKTGLPAEIVVTQELIDKHKNQARERLRQLIYRERREAKLEELRLIYKLNNDLVLRVGLGNRIAELERLEKEGKAS